MPSCDRLLGWTITPITGRFVVDWDHEPKDAMNWNQLSRNVGYLVRLRPPARRATMADGDWLIRNVDPSARNIELQQISSGHVVTLNGDHVYSFMSDPVRDGDGQQHGFLLLNVEMTLDGDNVHLEPRPWNQRGAPWTEEDREVTSRWLERSEFKRQYEDRGFRLSWANTERVRELIEDGCEVVYEDDLINRKSYRLVRRGQVLMARRQC